MMRSLSTSSANTNTHNTHQETEKCGNNIIKTSNKFKLECGEESAEVITMFVF